MKLISELRRRNVLRMAAIYVVSAWLILQFTEVLAGLMDIPTWLGPAVLVALAIGFPISLLFSWFYELTPEGITTDIDGTPQQSYSTFTGRFIDFVVISLLCAALALFAYDKWWTTPPPELSIAVLPFENMSPEPDTEYFSDGITEELLNALAKIDGLRVAARTSSFMFKGRDASVTEIGQALNVSYLLEGSVRKVGDKVRITAQLVSTRDGYHLWSDTYDRKMDDIFLIQDEISQKIAHALQLSLGPNMWASTDVAGDVDVKAYELYLEGRELVHKRDSESMEKATMLFDRSLRLDANFAPSHAMLAIGRMLQIQVNDIDREEALHIATERLSRARTLDSNLAEYHAGMALLSNFKNDNTAAIEHALAALALRPNYSDAMIWLEVAYTKQRMYVEADQVLEELLETDPLNLVGRINYIERLNHLGRSSEAHRHADLLMKIDKVRGLWEHGKTSLAYQGHIAESLRWELLAGKEYGLHSQRVSEAFRLTGEFEEARRAGDSPRIILSEGRGEDAIAAAMQIVERGPGNVWDAVGAGILIFNAGYADQARPLLAATDRLNPEILRTVLEPHMVMMVAWLKRDAGDEAAAMELVEWVREDLAVRTAAGRRHVAVDLGNAALGAFDGDREAVLSGLQSAIEHGWRDRLIFKNPMLESLQDDPELLVLKAQLDELLAREHRKVLELVCLNNPVPDDWRPLPETCAGFSDTRLAAY